MPRVQLSKDKKMKEKKRKKGKKKRWNIVLNVMHILSKYLRNSLHRYPVELEHRNFPCGMIVSEGFEGAQLKIILG